MANKKQPLRFKSLRSSLMQADTIVSVSRAQNEKILEFIPELRGKLHFIPLGIDTAYFKPVYEGRGNTILSVGRDNGRDYKTVLDAAKLLPDRNFEIVCSRRNMEGMPPIPSNVTVHYDLPSEELRKKYVEAELLLLLTHPDDFTDGSDCSGQTVLLDACANGLPVIATRKKYIDDYLKEYEEVLLVDPYDTEDVVQKIDTLKSPELRRTMAERARKTAEGFSTERFAEELSGLCRRILNNG